jgi:hypothetical protein
VDTVAVYVASQHRNTADADPYITLISIENPESASTWADLDLATLRLINLALIPQGVSKISQYCTKNFVAEPLLKAAVHGLVVRVALRKHVSLRAVLRISQHRLENLASGHRLRKSSSYCHVKVAVCGAYSLRQFFDAYARGPGTDMFVRGIRPRVFR